MSLRTKAITGLVGLSVLIPAKAQKTARIITEKPIVENVIKDTAKVKNKVTKDISLRTFQTLNGNNLTAIGTGFGKNYEKTSLYATPLFGYDFANGQPFLGGFASMDRRYSRDKSRRVWLAQELYGEFLKEKGIFDSKITYTPLKLNAKLSKKVTMCFNPRLAVHINKDGFTPQMETITSVSAPFDKHWSGYALFQTYDTTNLFKAGSINNIGINGGIVYTF